MSNMAESSVSALPEQGQIVTVRQRRFAVVDVRPSTLVSSALHQPLAKPQNLVTLNAIDDESLGETLQVIWELESGTRIEERLGLPELSGFDPPRRLDAFLNAAQWGAVSTADGKSLQAPFRSGIEIEDYQLDPLVRAVQMPRVNLLIADDVGLGKTIETGLIVQELLSRNRARTVLVICPAALQVQWRDQMRDKFGLEFRIVDSDLMKALRRNRGIHTNPWTHFPRLITSIDFLKRDRPMRLFREVLPPEDAPKYPRRFDILIVDEAHNVEPVGRGRYATNSLRTLAIRTLAPHFEHKLFVSATPHNGYKESFTALLELLDNQRFACGVEPDRQQLQAVMVRRLKSELPPRWDGTPRFPARHLEALEVDYTAEEKQAHAWLREYTALRQSNSRDEVERYATEFVLKLLKKRLFSSPAAFAATLVQHEQSLTAAQKPAAQANHRPSPGILRQYLDQAEEEYADDEAYETAESEALGTATRLFHAPTLAERDLLGKMRKWAEDASKRPDSKTRKLLDWLKQVVTPDGKWSDERVIIFTEYRATQKWLQSRLVAEGLTQNERLMTLYGGMPTEDREKIKAAFQADPSISPVRILLATDAASEGIDLQNHCHRVVHIEIPWNPNRLEQRNGRVDRHGQTHDVQIYHFVGAGYRKRSTPDALSDEGPRTLEADLEFLMRAAEKVEQIREDLGKVGPVIAQQVEEAMLGRRTRLQTEQAERDSEPVRRMLKFERDLRKAIAQQVEQLDETRRDMHMSPQHVLEAVQTALQIAGQPALIPLELPTLGGGKPITAYRLPALSGSWAACAEGLAHPHTGQMRPIVFDHELARGRDDVVLAHLNHRLVQMSLRLLRAEVWSPASVRGLHRVTARVVPANVLRTPAVIAYARLVVIGGNSYRLHEEITTAGGLLKEGRFQRMNVGEVQQALAAATDAAPPETITQRMRELWPQVNEPLLQALDIRMRTRAEAIQKQLVERCEQDIARMTAVLTELQNAIRTELNEPESLQLELFTSEEREQALRNHDALQLRLSQIPHEIESETAAIRARYANPEPRLFPIAVTFLVPSNLI
jgi:SNF2 family DNA or RNA helicase